MQLCGNDSDLGQRIISNPTIDTNSVIQFQLQAVDLGGLTKMYLKYLPNDNNSTLLVIDKAVIKHDDKDIIFKPIS